MFVALHLGSVSFAADSCKVSGYVKPDFLYESSENSLINEGFKVEIVELSNVSAFTNQTGHFEIAGVPENLTGYTLKISKAGYLQRSIKNVIVTDNLQINTPNNPLEIWAGDIAREGIQDNAINISDIMEIANVFNTSNADSRFNRDLDFNKDGSINMADVIIVASHFNKSSNSYAAFKTDLFMVSAVAVNNKTVEVTFNKKIDSAISKDKFFIPGLVINDAYIKADGIGQIVILKTSMQTAGTIYSVIYEGTKFQFGGAPTPSLEDCKISGLKSSYISNEKTSVKLSWVPFDKFLANQIGATEYEIFYKTSDSDSITTMTVSDLGSDSIQIDGLDAGKSYLFAICIRNESVKGFLSDYVTATFTPKSDLIPVSAVAINNKTVSVTFDKKIESVLSKDKFSIPGLIINEAYIKDDGTGKTMILKTSVQTAGTIYTVIYEDTEIKFGGIPMPGLEDCNITGLWANYMSGDKTSVKVLWVPMDDYLINETGATEYEIYYKTNDSNSITTVTVTDLKSDSTQINGLDAGKEYLFAICVRNKSTKGIISDYVTANLYISRPKMISAMSKSNTEVCITFDTQMDKIKAESISNYSIPGLTLLKAELDQTGKIITLITSNQIAGTIYTLTASNVTDINENLIDPDYTKSMFGGTPNIDKTKPRLLHAIAKSNTKLDVAFNEGMDKISAENISNYIIPGLSVLKAELDPFTNIVTLTTSSQIAGTIYKLTVSNITDITGNIIDADYNQSQFGGLPPDTIKPSLVLVQPINSTSLKVCFSEPMDKALASATNCYYLGPELGYPTGITKDTEIPNGSVWILATKPQSSKMYRLTVSYVTDENGNEIDPDKNEFSFPGIKELDTIKPKINSAVAINKNTVKIVFSEAMKISTISAAAFTFSLQSGVDNSTSKITEGSAHPDSILISDDNKSVTVNFTGSYMTGGVVYKVTADYTLQDEAGNSMTTDNSALFAGLSVENQAPKISHIMAINNQTLKIGFNKAITLTSSLVETDIEFSPSFTAKVNKCILSSDKTYITIYFSGTDINDKFLPAKIYTATLNIWGKNKIKDEFGTQDFSSNDDDARGTFAAISQAVTSPKISSVIAVNINTLDVTFDQLVDNKSIESLSKADFTISENFTGTTISAIAALARMEGDSGNKIRIFLDTPGYMPSSVMHPAKIYRLTISPGKVTNMNGLAMQADNSGVFASVSTENAPPRIVSVYKINSSQIKVIFSEKITGLQGNGSDFRISGSSIPGAISSAVIDTNDTSGKTVILTLSNSNLSPGVYSLSIAQYGIKDEAGIGNVDINSKLDFAY